VITDYPAFVCSAFRLMSVPKCCQWPITGLPKLSRIDTIELLTAARLMSHRRNRHMGLEATSYGGGRDSLTALRSISVIR
jgi:hypothetical protein